MKKGNKRSQSCIISLTCRLEKKRLKKEQGANQRNESLWPKCLYWIKQCSRFCSGERLPNSKYCVNHIHIENAGLEKTSVERKRVVCPIDPSHTVFEDKLQKHIRVCNKAKQETEQSTCPYFACNRNCGNVEMTKEMVFSNMEKVASFMSVFIFRRVSLRSNFQ